ncbi:MAG: methyltransferase domain-containing protein [Methylophaga sp.]|nr:methyltransferase domain-containing protein [Methylophaga sp.]
MSQDFPYQDTQISELHEARHQWLLDYVIASGVDGLAELGCGSGRLLWKILQHTDCRVTGVDDSGLSMMQARDNLRPFLIGEPPRATLRVSSYLDVLADLQAMPLIIMTETIEHIMPTDLSRVEHNVFGNMAPKQLVMTTPNVEFNVVYGLAAGRFRDPDHKFEWPRQKFQQWSQGVASRNGYQVRFTGIGDYEPGLGQPTQVAIFAKNAAIDC